MPNGAQIVGKANGFSFLFLFLFLLSFVFVFMLCHIYSHLDGLLYSTVLRSIPLNCVLLVLTVGRNGHCLRKGGDPSIDGPVCKRYSVLVLVSLR